MSSGLKWIPGPNPSLSSGTSSTLRVRRSSCGMATSGSGAPLTVVFGAGETGAGMT
jgi:hypothetical protein